MRFGSLFSVRGGVRHTLRGASARSATAVVVVALAASVPLLGGCARGDDAPIDKDGAGQQPASPGAVKAATTGAPVLDDCPHAAANDASGNDATCGHEEPGQGKHFGGRFTLASHQPLSAVAGSGSDAAAGGKVVRVSGTVESVCQKAGCWMVLQDGDTKARVFTKQNRFFLPRDIAGKRASVEGKLEVRTISEKFAKHLEGETPGGDPAKVTGPKQELLLYASVVELL